MILNYAATACDLFCTGNLGWLPKREDRWTRRRACHAGYRTSSNDAREKSVDANALVDGDHSLYANAVASSNFDPNTFANADCPADLYIGGSALGKPARSYIARRPTLRPRRRF